MIAVRHLLVLSILFSAATALAGETPYTAPPYEDKKVTINAEKIWHKSGKVWFKLKVVNGTDKPLTYDKEQIQANVSGKVLSREKSVFAGTAKAVTLAPALSGDLWVEYKASDTEAVTLLFSKAGFIQDGKAFPLKDYTATPGK